MAVSLGDRIRTRLWFLFPTRGIVVFVPGISEPDEEFERDGLRWVGVKGDDGSLFGELVDPESGCLSKRVVFLGKGGEVGAKR